MKRLSLSQMDFSGGYNSRDNPRAMLENECRSLVNQFPGIPPRPRRGVSRWSSSFPSGVTEFSFAWRDAKHGEKVIVLSNLGWSWHSRTAGGSITGSSRPRAGSKVCAQRVEGALIVGSDDPNGWSGIIEFDEKTLSFSMRKANILRPRILSIQTFDSLQGQPSGDLTPGAWYGYSATLVNLPEKAGQDVLSGFNAGKLESWEDRDSRVYWKCPSTGSIGLRLKVDGYDTQATHFRIYRTQPSLDETTVLGAPLLWLCDITLSTFTFDGVASTRDVFDLAAGVETDPEPSTSGYSEMPPCSVMRYMSGRLWVSGGPQDNPGRWHFSSGISSATGYLKSLTMFDPVNDYKDTSLDDSEVSRAACIVGDDLILLNDRSAYRIQGGDPANRVEVISSNIGCPFPDSVTEFNQVAYWLSYSGPMMIQAGVMDKVQDFKAGEVWPNSEEGGSFIKADRVLGFWYQDTWWLATREKVIGYHRGGDASTAGALEIEFADETIVLDHAVVFSETECVVIAAAASQPLLWFLWDSATMDNGSFFKAKITSRRFYVDPRNPTTHAEPWDMRVFAGWTDPGQIALQLACDNVRFRKLYSVVERPLTAMLQPQEAEARTRVGIQQAIQAGIHGSFFDLSFEKILRPPFDFRCLGFSLRAKLIRYYPEEHVSLSLGEDDPLDAGLAMSDNTERLNP